MACMHWFSWNGFCSLQTLDFIANLQTGELSELACFFPTSEQSQVGGLSSSPHFSWGCSGSWEAPRQVVLLRLSRWKHSSGACRKAHFRDRTATHFLTFPFFCVKMLQVGSVERTSCFLGGSTTLEGRRCWLLTSADLLLTVCWMNSSKDCCFATKSVLCFCLQISS